MTLLLTMLALLAFAANSILCRLALAADTIDPVSFTLLRLLSGMLILLPIASATREPAPSKGWKNAVLSGSALFIYALAFSLGYVTIASGIGTLILVGAVQFSMFAWAVIQKDPISRSKWIGAGISFAGLIVLVSPGLTAPDLKGATLMSAAGIAWGLYSIRGRGARSPVLMTARNFTCAVPIIGITAALFFQSLEISPRGAIIAVLSGSLTSGLAYVIWYRALRHLSTVTASMVQLLIPVLAAAGGVVFLDEPLTARLLISSALILGGVGLGSLKQSGRI
ncbi:DMT family transporter [Pontiella agarivorans]|uniref:DMT family transporter n=1 Tax=Pontiella agarivorans TaxID=3038953 RepID=A0ABU5MYD2_9BACT|nr:DMT family transporter [Pontiella agarivorans]MDZ8119215.1 DMT family transporter [Pontiella agarivorans]